MLVRPGRIGRIGLSARAPVAPAFAVRLVPDTTNSFWLMQRTDRGTALAHHFIRNTGGSTAGADVGGPWQPWRLVGTKEFASVTANPLTAAAIAVYADDIGAQNYAFQRSGQSAYMGSYHGGETLTAFAMTIDGVPIDPTIASAGTSFAYKYSSTITDGTATVTVTDFEIAIQAGAGVRNSVGSVSSTGSFSRVYIGMGIATADVWDEVGLRLVGGSGEIMAPLGYVAPYAVTYLGLAGDVRLRASATGRSIRCVGNMAAASGYRRTSAIRDPGRAKWYAEFATGVLGTRSALTWTVTFEAGATGAAAFAGSLLTNGDFAAGLTGWTSNTQVATGGSITAAGGKARLTRGTANDNRLFQGGATTVGAVYLVSAELVTSGGPFASLGATSNANGSTSSPAPAQAPVQFTNNGYNAHVFVATQATTYAMAVQSSGGAGAQGQTDDVDNIRLIKLANAA